MGGVIFMRRRRSKSLSNVNTDKPLSTFAEAVSAFQRHCKIRNLAETTQEYYKDVLASWVAEVGAINPQEITREHVESAILAKQDAGLAGATVNTYIRGWRAFFNFLRAEGIITEDLGKYTRPIKTEKRIIETFTRAQVSAILAKPERSTFAGYRNYVIMLALFDTGVRISELLSVDVSGIDWRAGTFMVYGKGRKERIVPFQSTLKRHLQEYVDIRGTLDHDTLFVNIDNRPLATRTIQQDIAEYGRLAGITSVRCSPHTFRHTFAKMYIMNDGDTLSLQKILGHSTLDMVKNYVNLFGVDIAAKHRKYSPLDRLMAEGDEE